MKKYNCGLVIERGRGGGLAKGRPWAARGACLALAMSCLASFAQVVPMAPQHLRIVGGFGAVNQYTRHEEPFWSRELFRLSGGSASAEIVPFDRAGVRGQEMLRLVQLGTVPFGTFLLNVTASFEAEIGAPDLAGLSPDVATLRRNVDAFRPYLAKMLKERYGTELLAIYAYPAQVTFCAKPVTGLSGLAGRRIRVSSATQADWVTALGAIPVQAAFAEIVANMRSGNIDCAITGTMSGNAIGLHEVTSHLHTTSVNWGVAAFVANGAAWAALPKDLQDLLQRELPKLEQAIWTDAEAETRNGIACNIGAASCVGGKKGHMIEVRPSAADTARGREILVNNVLPSWLKRCGPQCAPQWKQTVGAATGIELR